MTTKAELRVAARAKRVQLAAELPDFADLIAGCADDLALPPQAVVASYWPMGAEADPRALTRALVGLGHPIILPCVTGRRLVFRRWREGDELVTTPFGVSEPLAAAPDCVPAALLVPLLAFDADGYRLGYGGGYYDRTLAELRALGPIVAVGVAFGGQEVTHLPRESHDQPLDMVITEHGVRHFPRG